MVSAVHYFPSSEIAGALWVAPLESCLPLNPTSLNADARTSTPLAVGRQRKG